MEPSLEVRVKSLEKRVVEFEKSIREFHMEYNRMDNTQIKIISELRQRDHVYEQMYFNDVFHHKILQLVEKSEATGTCRKVRVFLPACQTTNL